MNLHKAKQYILQRLAKELPNNLHYHGVHHTIDVHQSAIKLAQLENITKEEQFIVETAALYHDAGFLFQYEYNEILAVDLIHEVLPQFNYSKEQINIFGNIILTTRIYARPHTLLEKIMSDADYDYLGRADVKFIANTLYKELLDNGASFTEKEWNELQIRFLNKHQFFTTTAIKLRRQNKNNYIAYLMSLKIT